MDKDNVKDLLLFSLCLNRKIENLNIKQLLDYIKTCPIPKFPISGEYLKKYGYKSGINLGKKLKSLEEKWIAGAGLDVFEQEPPDPENPLLHMENVIATPHVASASQRMAPETRRRVGQEISLVLTGRWPRTCVNPAVLADAGLKRWQPYSMGRGPGSG